MRVISWVSPHEWRHPRNTMNQLDHHQARRFKTALRSARIWATRSGWPERQQDLQLAINLWHQLELLPLSPEERGKSFIALLLEKLPGPRSAVRHRALLVRALMRSAGLDD